MPSRGKTARIARRNAAHRTEVTADENRAVELHRVEGATHQHAAIEAGAERGHGTVHVGIEIQIQRSIRIHPRQALSRDDRTRGAGLQRGKSPTDEHRTV